MSKRMNLYFHDSFYELLIEKIGRRKISEYIEKTLTPLIINNNLTLEEGYKKMAKDTAQMKAAIKMANACVGDINHETW